MKLQQLVILNRIDIGNCKLIIEEKLLNFIEYRLFSSCPGGAFQIFKIFAS